MNVLQSRIHGRVVHDAGHSTSYSCLIAAHGIEIFRVIKEKSIVISSLRASEAKKIIPRASIAQQQWPYLN